MSTHYENCECVKLSPGLVCDKGHPVKGALGHPHKDHVFVCKDVPKDCDYSKYLKDPHVEFYKNPMKYRMHAICLECDKIKTDTK